MSGRVEVFAIIAVAFSLNLPFKNSKGFGNSDPGGSFLE